MREVTVDGYRLGLDGFNVVHRSNNYFRVQGTNENAVNSIVMCTECKCLMSALKLNVFSALFYVSTQLTDGKDFSAGFRCPECIRDTGFIRVDGVDGGVGERRVEGFPMLAETVRVLNKLQTIHSVLDGGCIPFGLLWEQFTQSELIDNPESLEEMKKSRITRVKEILDSYTVCEIDEREGRELWDLVKY